MFRHKKAQSLSEYAVLIGLVASIFFTMQTYLKRNLQGKIKEMTDAFIAKRQFVAKESSSHFQSSSSSESDRNILPPYITISSNETSERQGNEYSVPNEEWLDLLPIIKHE